MTRIKLTKTRDWFFFDYLSFVENSLGRLKSRHRLERTESILANSRFCISKCESVGPSR